MNRAFFALMLLAIACLNYLMIPAEAQTSNTIISIPSISVSTTIVHAPFSTELQTWDVSHLSMNVGHLEYTPWFGTVGNIGLAGHSENLAGTADIFYLLDDVVVGDEIYVEDAGFTYRYIVTQTKNVDWTDLSILLPSRVETLTLFTCDTASYNGNGGYSRRYVVVAERIN